MVVSLDCLFMLSESTEAIAYVAVGVHAIGEQRENSCRRFTRCLIKREKQLNHQYDTKQHNCRAVLITLVLACLGLLCGCGPAQSAQTSTTKPAANTTGEAQPATAKRYPLTGRVVSVDKPNRSINIDADAIPGFMSAMTMPYAVKDAGILEKVAPGDQIKAEIVIGDEGAHLENVVATKTPPQTPTK
jgi:Cu/Ag efflux protein CusF